jgi:hypothetical protein
MHPYPSQYESWFPLQQLEDTCTSHHNHSNDPNTQTTNASSAYNDKYTEDINNSLASAPLTQLLNEEPRSLPHALNISSLASCYDLSQPEFPTGTSDVSDESESSQPALDIAPLLEANTPENLLHLFLAGHIQRRAGKTRWEVECPDCKMWINTSLSVRFLADLNIPGYFKTLCDHRDGKKCSKTPHTIPAISSITSVVVASPRPFHTPTSCVGIPIDWPIQGPSFLETFPVGRASEGRGMLPFDIDTRGDTPHAYSKLCDGNSSMPGVPCDRCAEIAPFISHLVSVSEDIKPHTNFRYLSHFSLINQLKHYMTENNRLKLKVRWK